VTVTTLSVRSGARLGSTSLHLPVFVLRSPSHRHGSRLRGCASFRYVKSFSLCSSSSQGWVQVKERQAFKGDKSNTQFHSSTMWGR